MWRKLRKIFFWLVGITFGLLLVLVFVIWLMQDKIKGYAISYLNDHLKTELKVDDIEVTFISTFPNVSLHFKNTLILDPEGLQSYRDTLLSAKSIYVKFGLWDVFSGKYNAKKLDVYNAHLRGFINEKGEENYDILKPSPEKPTGKKSDFKLDLQQVTFYNTRLTYHNAAMGQQYKLSTNTLKLSGKLGNDVFDLATSGDVYINSMRNKNVVLLKNQQSTLDLILSINTAAHTVAFKKGDWKIEKMHLGIKGNITNQPEGTLCDVTVFGKNVSLVSVMQLLPDKIHRNMSRYKSFGNLSLDATIKGLAGKTSAPAVNATFSIGNGILIEKQNNISLHNIDLSGAYTNKNKLGVDELRINTMSGRFKDGSIDMHGQLTDFGKPHIVLTVKGEIGLATLHDFVNPETIKEMKGRVSLDSRLDFVLMRTDNLLLDNTLINEASGSIRFVDATVLVSERGKPVTGLNGQLNLRDNDALVDGLQGKIGESDFSINGAIKNFTPYFLAGNQTLSVIGAFNSSYCNIEDLVVKSAPLPVAQKTVAGEAPTYSFPSNLNFNFDLNIAKLEWDPFTATNIRGNFKLVDKKLSATNLSIDLAGGKCTGSLSVDESGNQFLARANTHIDNVKLPLMLGVFKNFGQKLITPENTKGTLTATVDWAMPIGNDLKIDDTKMVVQASISIKKGELNNLNQLRQLATFMRTDKKLKLFLKGHADDFEGRVRSLKFDELKNDLTIAKGELTIPRMEIKSSAMNIDFYGKHNFENKIDYHFNFRFLELKKRENQTEFGEIRDDGTGMKVYIRMFGDLNSPQYEWDKAEAKADKKEKWETEKSTFKSLVKEEFGFFKRDTTVKTKTARQEDVDFIMQWDEAEPAKTVDQPQSEKDNQKLKKVRKRLGIDEKTNKDVKFDIEE